MGDFELAEEAAQEAFAAGVQQLREDEVPEFPRAWMIQTARHKAIDLMWKRARAASRVDTLNRAVAVAMVSLDEYHLLYSAQAELLRRGDKRARAGVGE